MKRYYLLSAIAAVTACDAPHADDEPESPPPLTTASDPTDPDQPPDDLVRTIGSDEALALAEQIADMYRPAAAMHHGAEISVIPKWDRSDWSVHPEVTDGRKWTIYPTAGIFTEHCTRDTMRWVVCHEMGHFFGGFPFSRLSAPRASIEQRGTFSSSEGNADYFSTKDCLPRLWANDPGNAAFRTLVPDQGRSKCDAAWSTQAERDICYRSIVVAKKAMRWLGYTTDITTPDTSVTSKTKGGHFNAQCRFDTMVAGALCNERNDLSLIPGLIPSPVTGRYADHSVASEQQARPYACHGDHPGARPRCWFKPDMPDIGFHDCSDQPIGGFCDGNTLVTCTPREGVQRFDCIHVCARVEDPDSGEIYHACVDPLDP